MKDRMDDPLGGADDPLHLPDQHDTVDALTGFVEEAAVLVADLLGDVAEAMGLTDHPHGDDSPTDTGHHDNPDSPDSPDGTGHGDATDGPSVEDRLTAAYEHPESAVPLDPDAGPDASVRPPATAGPYGDPVIDEVAGYNPAAADTMAFIHGVLHADPKQLDAMNAQLQGIVAQDRIHASVADHEAQQAEDAAFHQAVQDADRTSTEAEGVLRRDPT
ncbi:hypothetical protein [Kitasatospora sp. NPDC007106]|uniref:hypothetical protein n=1 Tax=Kitasatospora sp. NPDC007106 TaxID=3156914 RepID=UPI0033EEB247